MSEPASLNEVVATLYAAPLQPGLWMVALRQLARTIDIRQAALFDHGPGVHKIFAFVGDPIAEGAPLYEKHYWQHDEWTHRFSRAPLAGGLLLGELAWPEVLLKKSVFYNEFLLKHEVCQVVAIPSQQASGSFNCLSIYREPDGAVLDQDQYNMLRCLAPAVKNALALRRRLGDLDSRINDLETALNQVAVGLILLDRRGRPLMMNAAAQELCCKRDGFFVKGNSLSASTLSESSDLKALIERTVANSNARDTPRSGAMTISRINGRPLHIIVTPISAGRVDAPRKTAAILLLSDPDKEKMLPGDVLRQLFSLTPAECRLALRLLAGSGLPDAAEFLGVGRETVRSQMKSIFQKTATKRQGELIGLLSGLSNLGN